MRYYRVASQVYVLTKDKPRNCRRLYDVRNTQVGSEMGMKLRDKDGLGRRRMHRVTQEIGYRGDVWEYLTWTMCEDLAALEHGSVMHRDRPGPGIWFWTFAAAPARQVWRHSAPVVSTSYYFSAGLERRLRESGLFHRDFDP